MKILMVIPHYGWCFGLASSMPDNTFYVINKLIEEHPTSDLSISNGYWKWLRSIKPKPTNVKLLGKNLLEIDTDDYDVALLIPDAGQVDVWNNYLNRMPVAWKFHLCNSEARNVLKEKPEMLGGYPCIYSADTQMEFYGIKGTVAWSQSPKYYKDWIGDVERAMWTCERIGIPNDARYMQRGGNIWDQIHPYVRARRYGLDFRLGTPITAFEELVTAYRFNRCYVECATNTILTDGLIEAMLTGMPPVVYAGWEMDRVIEHEVNGFKSTDPKEMIKYINLLLEDYDLAKQIGKRAQKTALELWSPEVTRDAYQKAFEQAVEIHNTHLCERDSSFPLLAKIYSLKSQATTVDDFLSEISRKRIVELEIEFGKQFSNMIECSHCLKRFEMIHIKGMHYVKPIDTREPLDIRILRGEL